MTYSDATDQIERKAERQMDRLDDALLSGRLSQDDYDGAVKALDEWVSEAYREIRWARTIH